MRQTISRVEDGLLYHSETGEEPIVVGTPAWYDWLEHHTSFLFTDLAGTFTVRKSGSESRAQDWEAVRTRASSTASGWDLHARSPWHDCRPPPRPSPLSLHSPNQSPCHPLT